MSTDRDSPEKLAKRCAKSDRDDILFVEMMPSIYGSVIPLSWLFTRRGVRKALIIAIKSGLTRLRWSVITTLS